MSDYHGYNPHVDPTITEEFAGAAYRFGHSIVSAEITAFGEQGQELAAQDLKDAFFEPASVFASTGDGADGLLRHLAADKSNALDVHIVDDLRNFLFDPGDGQDGGDQYPARPRSRSRLARRDADRSSPQAVYEL